MPIWLSLIFLKNTIFKSYINSFQIIYQLFLTFSSVLKSLMKFDNYLYLKILTVYYLLHAITLKFGLLP